MLKIVTMAGQAPILSLDQYIMSLPNSVGDSNQDYVDFVRAKGIPKLCFSEKDLDIVEDMYQRTTIKVKSNKALFKSLKDQFLKQIRDNLKVENYKKLSTLEAFEEASLKYMDNFGGDNFSYINLGLGNYILAPLDADVIQLRRMDLDKACVLVFYPHKFVPFKAGNITSLKKDLKRMMRYQDGTKCTRLSK